MGNANRENQENGEGGSSLLRMLSVLDLFSIEAPRWTVEEIANSLNFTQSTAYRYVAALCLSGLLAPFGSAGYVLGARIIELDRQIRQTDPVIALASKVAPKLLGLVRQGVVSLFSLRGDTVISVFQEKKPLDINISYERGKSMGLFNGAAAKAIVAYLPRTRQTKLFLDWPDQIAKAGLGKTWKEFSKTLLDIRRERVVITRGEVEPTSWGLAAPVFDPDGNIISSINLIMPIGGYRVANVDKLKDAVSRAATEISDGLNKGSRKKVKLAGE